MPANRYDLLAYNACIRRRCRLCVPASFIGVCFPSSDEECRDPFGAVLLSPRGHHYKAVQIKECIKTARHGFESSAEANSPRRAKETSKKAMSRRRSAYDARITGEANEAEASMRSQWPCERPDMEAINSASFRNRDAATAVNRHTQTWFRNLCFFRYLSCVCGVLNEATVVEVEVSIQSPNR